MPQACPSIHIHTGIPTTHQSTTQSSILPNIPQQPPLPRPLLPHNRPDLLGWQHKPDAPLRIRRAQLHCPRMVGSSHSMMVISRITSREIQNLTARAGQILAPSRTSRFDGRGGSGSRFEHAIDGLRERVAGEAPGGEDQLAVGVEVDEGANAGGRAVTGAVGRGVAG
jgi:hypothetical protein